MKTAREIAKSHELTCEDGGANYHTDTSIAAAMEQYAAQFKSKAKNWDKLGDSIEEVYNDDSGGGDLMIIGEKAARAYGWL